MKNKRIHFFQERKKWTRPLWRWGVISLSLTLGCPMVVMASGHESVGIEVAQQGRKTLAEIFKNIEQSTNYRIVFNASDIDVNSLVSVNTNDKSAEEILKEALVNTGCEFEIKNKQIIIYKQTETSTTTAIQKKHYRGVVYDDMNLPVIGASVAVKGTTNGTITDVDGNFEIESTDKNTLLISFIGYKDMEIKLAKNTNLGQLVLNEDTEQLEEVIVVGYGVQKKVNLTGSVSSVNGKDLEHRPVANAVQSLQGLVPGLTVSNNSSGRPGAAGSITLRGQGNLSNTANPYVLVDGVEMSLSDVNPNDIQNISVLKDAAASAIYGARAAYGVILVTTKKGEEGKMRISYQGSTGWSAPTVLPKMANAYDFAEFFNEACRNAGVAQQYSPEKLDQLQSYMKDPSSVDPWAELGNQNNLVGAFENTAKGVGNVDYFKLHYKNYAFKQNHNMSVSGGGKSAQYYVSGGLYDEEGILKYADMNYSRFNFTASMNSQITDWLKMKVNTKYMHSKDKSPFGEGGLSDGFYHSLARFRPTVNERDPNGNFTELTMIPYLQSGTSTKNDRDNFSITTGFEVEPLKDWRIFLDYTYKQNNSDYKALNVAPLIPGADNTTMYKGTRGELGVSEDGSFTRNMNKNRYKTINLYTNYTYSINDQHNFTGMLGYQEEDNNYSYLFNQVTNLISPTNPGLNLSTGDKKIKDIRTGWATRGFFGRINYDYEGKYLVEVNGRYDASSRFDSNNRWGFFPSVSLGWNVARESFMQNFTDILSNLKVRGSWGLLGNQNGAGLYTFSSTMGVNPLGNYFFNDGRDMYINAPGVVDPNTTWEKVESRNIGLDFGFFGNSLTGTFDLFQRDTKDMLGPSADLADIFGANVPNTNNARMKNKGWELSLQYRGTINSDISYSVGASIADATSKVTEYENPTGTKPQDNWYVGKKVGEIWGYRTDGLIQTQEEADIYNSTHDMSYLSGLNWTPGDVKYRDLNNDGKVNNGDNTTNDMGDLTVIGNTTPRYQYTFNGAISWKGLSFSFLFQGVGKRDWTPNMGTVYFWGTGPYAQVTVFKEHLDYWTPDNPNAYYPKPYTAGAGAIGKFRNKTSQVSDRYLQNAAYCRLKNITISYDLPSKWVNKVGLNKAQVFFSGENLWTITKLSDIFDPEAIFTGNSYTSESGKNYPMNKVLSVGLVVNL